MRRLLLCGVLLVAVAAPADAAPRSTTRGGMTLAVSEATGVAPAGQRVRVTGKGYDRAKGVYIAFCVDNGPGKQPTPCGGGADTEGSSGNSVWVSDLPPAYGTGLAQPYGEGGTFDVQISVKAQLKEGVDCRVVRCAVVTRADHTRSDDRSLDVLVPITFARAAPAPRPSATAPVVRSSAAPAPSADAGGAAASASASASPTTAAAPGTAAPTPAATAPAAASATASPAVAKPPATAGGRSLPLAGTGLVLGGLGGAALLLVRRRRRGA